MVSDVYMICDAYESGVGKGRDKSDCKNPYPNTPGVNAQCHEAWDIGYQFGSDAVDSEEAEKKDATE